MKKLLAFFSTVVPREGVYLPYSWHAPLNEASAATALKAQAANHSAHPARSSATFCATWV